MRRRVFGSCWALGLLLSVAAPVAVADTAGLASATSQQYAYATNGILDHIAGGSGSEWKLLLNESNLGGKELEMVEVTSKPLFLYGRYTKPRGVAQRVLFCEECNGRGCERCRGTGYSSSPSVEGIVSKRLGALLGSKKFKFTWFGSEDPDSIVYPPGRPMVVDPHPRPRITADSMRPRLRFGNRGRLAHARGRHDPGARRRKAIPRRPSRLCCRCRGSG